MKFEDLHLTILNIQLKKGQQRTNLEKVSIKPLRLNQMHYMATLNRVFVLEENGTGMKTSNKIKKSIFKKIQKKKEELKSQSQEFYETLFEKHQQSF